MKAKKLIRQFRANNKKALPPLIHLLINLKSINKSAYKSLKSTLLDKSLDFEHGIKNKVVSCYKDSGIFQPFIRRPIKGNKTYFDEKLKKFVSFNPDLSELPF